MKLFAVFGVTVLLTIGLIATSAWAASPDDATTGPATSFDEAAATPFYDPEIADMTAAAPQAPPVEADSDCLIVLRNTDLSDAEQQIDEKMNMTWIATDAERETPEKCRAIGAR